MPATRSPTRLDELLRWFARKQSVFGSDIYVSYTHEYVWQANQFGHVLIGLFVTLALGWLLCGSAWALVVLVCVYALKETIDFLIAVRLQEGVFRVSAIEAFRDGFTDWFFVASGGLAALVVLDPAAGPWASCAAGMPDALTAWWTGVERAIAPWLLIVLVFVPALYFLGVRTIYLPGKRAFDKSDMPHYVRLPTYPDNFGLAPAARDALAAAITGFARNGAAGGAGQIVISGPPRSGRTTLALSIGGEATTVRRAVRYVSAQRLREKAGNPFEVAAAPDQPHQVSEADLVIVDGLDPSALASGSADDWLTQLAGIVDCTYPEDPPGTTTVFQRPPAARPPPGSAQEPAIPVGAQPRALPQIVWVSNGAEHADALVQALRTKFGLDAGQVLAIPLAGGLKRSLTADL